MYLIHYNFPQFLISWVALAHNIFQSSEQVSHKNIASFIYFYKEQCPSTSNINVFITYCLLKWVEHMTHNWEIVLYTCASSDGFDWGWWCKMCKVSALVNRSAEEITGNEWIIKCNFWLLWATSVPICINAASSQIAVDFNKIIDSYNFRAEGDFRDLCTLLCKILVKTQTSRVIKSFGTRPHAVYYPVWTTLYFFFLTKQCYLLSKLLFQFLCLINSIEFICLFYFIFFKASNVW